MHLTLSILTTFLLVQSSFSSVPTDCSLFPEICYDEGVTAIEAITKERSTHISSERHNHRAFLTGKREEYAVLAIHGNFEAPRAINGIAEFFHDQYNANVFSVLLPGFWESPLEKLDDISYQDWTREIDRAVQIVSLLGKKVIVFGHSLGGVLAIYSAIKYPELIDVVFASAPALKQTNKTILASSFGSLFDINGNEFFNIRGDGGYSVPYISPRTGLYISNLVTHIKREYGKPARIRPTSSRYRRDFNFSQYSVPTMLIVSEADDVISTYEAKRFYRKLNVPKDILIYEETHHDAINKARGDYRLYNREFEGLTQRMSTFMQSLSLD